MDDRSDPRRDPPFALSGGPLTAAGLGPGTLSRTPWDIRAALFDPANRVILRTAWHPAAAEVLDRRPDAAVCDDLYEEAEAFEEVYGAIAERVLAAAGEGEGPVVYAVPGSPLYGERSVAVLRERCRAEGRPIRVLAAPSFLDEVWAALEFDPTERGFTVLDGRDLPDPLMLYLPTVVFQVDTPVVLAEAAARLARTLPHDAPVTVLTDLGTPQASWAVYPIGSVPSEAAGLRTSLFLDPPDTGLAGAVRVMRRLRAECPWDRRQTHESLIPYAVEETFELVEAVSRLPSGAPDAGGPDYGAYADVEEELGDMLLQVIFHSNLASEAGAFDIEDAAEGLLRKLVKRHPHVFGGAEAADADEVTANWHAIKAAEKPRSSLLDGVPGSLPGLERAAEMQKRAARVGFDWPDARSAAPAVQEELDELAEALEEGGPESRAAARELGDLLFAAVNLARHMKADPEIALRRAAARFESRFRRMEELDDLASAGLDRLNALWERAKREEAARGGQPGPDDSQRAEARRAAPASDSARVDKSNQD